MLPELNEILTFAATVIGASGKRKNDGNLLLFAPKETNKLKTIRFSASDNEELR